jgi:hypothetical protein
MRINQIEFNQPTVVILGAGATRGASFVHHTNGVLPPLDTDFFTQAQRLSASKPRELIHDLVQNVVSVFGTNFDLTMEGYLTQIEHLANVFDDYRLAGRPPANPYPAMREQFMQVLAAVMDESIGRHPNCHYHSVLAHHLDAEDALLSFNYDWVMDMTLRDNRPDIWNPISSYGLNAYVQGERGQGTQFWASEDSQTGDKVFPDTPIQLLKLHGSMNWFPVPYDSRSPRLHLRQRWWHQRGKLRFEIIPPEWNKQIRSGAYRQVWRNARRALREAASLAFLGYSLPHTDLPAKALFMVDAGAQAAAPDLDLLILANPDPEARARIREVLNRRINSETRVLTFDYFSEFAEYLSPGQ